MFDKLSWAKVFIIFSSLFLAGGCWNYREINRLNIVAGIGIDLDQKTNQVIIFAQLIKPAEVKAPEAEGGGAGGGSKGGGRSKAVWILRSNGATVFDAFRNSTRLSSRKLYFSHNQIIVLSKEAAQSGVRQLLDFFVRDPEARQSVKILVASGEVSEIMEQKTEDEKIPAMGIDSMIEGVIANSQASNVNLQEFTGRLMSKTTAPVCSLIEIIEENGQKRLRLKGTAVFKGDKLAGELNKVEARGLLWVVGKVKSGITVVSLPDNGGKAGLEIIRAGSRIVPELKKGQVKISIYIDTHSNLGCQMSSAELAEPEKMLDLSKLQAAVIKGEINAALKKARNLKADIFGFGDAIRRRYPKEWKELEKNWDRIFPVLNVVIKTNPKIERFGMIAKPVEPPKQ